MTEPALDVDMPTDTDVLHEKLRDAMVPGATIELDPDEAEQAGAFLEDALTEEEALESTPDLLESDRESGHGR